MKGGACSGKISLLLCAAVTICLLAACLYPPTFPPEEETYVIIEGKMVVTRNDVPWNLEDCYYYERNDTYVFPEVIAYLGPPDLSERIYLGSSGSTRRPPNTVSWFGKGEYRWSMEIPKNRLPAYVFFGVRNRMDDVNPSTQEVIPEGVWIRNEYAKIDLGVIDFRVIRLSGNLPITINGEPLNETDRARLNIKGLTGYSTSLVAIKADGNWAQSYIQPDSERPVSFELYLERGPLSLIMEISPDTDTVYDTDREIIFPDYPNIDFEMVTLSGTTKVLAPDANQVEGRIWFRGENFKNTNIRWCYNYLDKFQYEQSDDGWLAQWQLTVPALSLPQQLGLELGVLVDNSSYGYVPFSIDITDNSGLDNIALDYLEYSE